MKTKNILVLLLAASLLLLSGCAQTNQPPACTQEAKLCPDGSYVGRTGPNCEFAQCPNATSCTNYSVDNCPSQCVICPPCAACSSIGCHSKEFCESIGFNSTWYNETKPNCVCPQGYIQEGNVCNPNCYYSTPKCLAPSILCNATEQMAKAKACINSFGNVTTKSCCKSVSDFPDTCLIGACGCSLENSHEVLSCDCGEGRCWDSSRPMCMTPTPAIPSNASEAASVVNANDQFAFDLYSQYKYQDGNIFFSPYSISTALAMTYEGARGQTADEMQTVFHFPADDNTRRSGFLQLYNDINAANKNYSLSTANALWAQKDYKFLDSYFNLIHTYYGGNVTNLDFIGDTENSRVTINNWVAEQTNNKIKDIIPPGAITEMTRLVITNAVYFKARWYIPFLNATDDNFKVSPAKTVTVKMMSLEDAAKTYSGDYTSLVFNYTETDQAQIIELPYVGNETSMLVILPKGDSLQPLEQSLSLDKLNQWKGMLKETELGGVYMPKFKFETTYMMGDTLENMGMKAAFNPSQADFSGMDGNKDLYISAVIHKAFVEVNETGTEAAAATAVILAATGIENPPKPVFRADHPFIFIIQQKDTGNILFMGRVSDPTAT